MKHLLGSLSQQYSDSLKSFIVVRSTACIDYIFIIFFSALYCIYDLNLPLQVLILIMICVSFIYIAYMVWTLDRTAGKIDNHCDGCAPAYT